MGGLKDPRQPHDIYRFANVDRRQIYSRRLANENRFGVPCWHHEDALATRVMDATCMSFVPREWLPECIPDQRLHLGALDIPTELHSVILEHMQDAATIVAFACAHNILAESALRRLSTLLAGVSLDEPSTWGTWAGDRIVILSDNHPLEIFPEGVLITEPERREFAAVYESEPDSDFEGTALTQYTCDNFSDTREEDNIDGGVRSYDRRHADECQREGRYRYHMAHPGRVLEKIDRLRAIHYLELSRRLPLAEVRHLKYADEVPITDSNSIHTPVLLSLDRREYARLQYVSDKIDGHARDCFKYWSDRYPNNNPWTASETVCGLMCNSWGPANRLRITLLNRSPMNEEGAAGRQEWKDISDEFVHFVIGRLQAIHDWRIGRNQID